MSISNQMMKGLLDGAILALISQGETYGYEILDKLESQQFPEISDGSIYPVLLRLSKKGYVISISKKSDSGGPKRKYYSITEEGKMELANFKYKWNDLNNGMNNLMWRVNNVE
ncbi:MULTISPECIES: PadR family transcriptional regulator [Staphylococcus]|jgi:PadR family transcriptional regulator PadR|uniref:Transcriptional regulator n=1 Tax=Staphylococcus nepalensis TaxID=214473 RepID=A0A2T4SB30_9STAP|nr:MULTISPECIES: PadR family transcriptional regulator [Staphylococcus]VDG66260.1 PadR family transcriptional regulator [Lacrimispora indolis]MBO1205646.1 PadR family transcriptional regulator [Staphylococcus nepalensis]MBO1212673.1 PadR family transcriptional regulator [Staphylococcus nepalensis]MBO1215882.1 PadR family transcriptional regulator [Staphylococcus nepalensis]MBO1221110.1 PadR family transcriptional regulator [Staphylococcus nepalensis]